MRARLHDPPDQRAVLFLHFPLRKLTRQRLVCVVVLRDHHQPRGALVEPVHDAGSQLAADAAEILDAMQQRIDQRARVVPGGRVHDHAGRFVHDDQIRILVDDRQRDVFGDGGRRRRLGNVDGDAIAGLDGQIGFRGAPGHRDLPLLDQPLNLRTRLARDEARQISVEPFADLIGSDLEADRGHRAGQEARRTRADAGTGDDDVWRDR